MVETAVKPAISGETQQAAFANAAQHQTRPLDDYRSPAIQQMMARYAEAQRRGVWFVL